MSWLMPARAAASVRNGVGFDRSYGSKPFGGPGGGVDWPVPKGTVLTGSILGLPAAVAALPTAQTASPWGIVARRATLAPAFGADVAGTVTQIPGSMCSAPPLGAASLICCR